ncbi:unnamed protein product [Hermetia illucens]|uniref:Kazal-like domain-containing protein n=1 Tax=Hermetia illucens TaxID=343691 RepID=A0A7R8YUJ0_HERIL|nr:enhancer of split M1 protein-like isoform X1 [Hermetia illucens]CAD7084826.1 unnamed protein product [Hermetia illucens]
MIKFTIICLSFACALGAEPLLCMRYCGNEDASLTCATNGDSYLLFKNECELKNKECTSGETWTTSSLTKCLNNVIPIKSPIVGVPEKPVIEIPEKPVLLSQRAGCVRPCYLLYQPVCGYDGNEYKAFDNDCFMSTANCNRDASTSFLAVGPEKCNIQTITSN